MTEIIGSKDKIVYAADSKTYGPVILKVNKNRNELATESKMLSKLLPEGIHKIRTYEELDFREYNEIQAAAFWIMKEKVGIRPNYWNLESNPEYLKENAKDCFVIFDGEIKVGFGRIHGAEVALLAIRPDYQHCGYGTVVGNPAYQLYQKLGFHKTKTKMNYYKLYRPDHRAEYLSNLVDADAIIKEFHLYGKLRNESE